MSYPSWLGRVVVTENGVYQPPLFLLEGALLLVALFVVLLSLALGRVSLMSAGPSLTMLVALAVIRLVAYRRHGLLGKPSVALHDGTLVLALPQDSRGQVVLALAEFHELIVYGRMGRRIYRFVRHGGTHLEVVPAWRPKVEQVALTFLQGKLPPAVRVTVEAPQTLFASIRGDGP